MTEMLVAKSRPSVPYVANFFHLPTDCQRKRHCTVSSGSPVLAPTVLHDTLYGDIKAVTFLAFLS